MRKTLFLLAFFLCPLILWSASPVPAPTALTITSAATLAPATQYKSYAVNLTASGGVPPYTWSVTTADTALPEGMTLNAATGAITSSAVGGQGGYQFQVQVTDAASGVATKLVTINVAADNSLGGCGIFPADSIFHQRVDALPVDTSPAAAIYSGYLSSKLRVFWGAAAVPYPNGIPFIRVPYNQAPVAVTFNQYGDESDPSPYPYPANAPVEGTALSEAQGGDGHVLVLQTAGGGKSCQLYETWMSVYNGNNAWTAANGAHWDLGSDALRPLGWTSGDAAGLPIMPLTVNYDEVASGVVSHPIRFTLNHILNYMVWPARHTAGTGTCSDASGNAIPVQGVLSQASPPKSCTFGSPAGEIYRLMAGVDISACAADPQATVILTAMKHYGIIVADNGSTGGVIGTPDSRWNDADLACLSNFTLSQFEPVNVSSLQVSADSGATPVLGRPNAPTNLATISVQ
jgi:hypothetical protein